MYVIETVEELSDHALTVRGQVILGVESRVWKVMGYCDGEAVQLWTSGTCAIAGQVPYSRSLVPCVRSARSIRLP